MNLHPHSSARLGPSAPRLALTSPNAVLGWRLPLAAILAGLGAIQWLDSENAAPDRAKATNSRLDAEHWRNLGLMSGNGFLLVWLLALAHWRRLPKAGATARWHGAATAAGGLALVAVWSLGLILSSRDELMQVLAIFMYAPTLVIAFGLVALAVRRWRRFGPVAAPPAGLATLNLLCQLGHRYPAGRAPGTAVFALGSLPIAAGVAFWLAVQSRAAVASPAPPAS